jgi:glycosyltransferase involved in cell wall biosynthesis
LARPVRVLLVLGALDGGGAERVALTLLQGCDPARVDVSVALLRADGAFFAEADRARMLLPARAARGPAGAVLAPLAIAGMVARAKPDVVMSFGMLVNLATRLALGGRARPPWICREDSHPAAEIAALRLPAPARAALWAIITRLYRSADCLFTSSADAAAILGARRVIHNPIDIAAIDAAAREPLAAARPFIATAGRLTRQKGFDLLIEAFARSRGAEGLDLVILGEGPLRGALEAQAQALGVADRVRLLGFQANPWRWFARASLFVLSSRWEGFGNVVAEAMACGAPVVAADCDFGPREQIVHGQSGWLVPPGDAVALTAALDAILGDEALARRLGEAGRERARLFDRGPILEAYMDMLVEEAKAAARWTRPAMAAQSRK